MNFVRRVLMVLGIAGAAGAILRLKGRSVYTTRHGGWESFQFNGLQLFFNTMFLGLFVVVLLTAIWVLCATVFNLITDLVGGIRVSVLEEEVVVSTVEGEGKRQ